MQLIWASCFFYFDMTNKEVFLEEHNKLSSIDLRATVQLLARFEAEKPALCRNNKWSIEKVRRPFIMWLTSMKAERIRTINRGEA